MKKLSVLLFLLASSLATQAFAGTLTVVGSQTVSTNLAAQSITLGTDTRTSWPDGSARTVVDLTNAVLDFAQPGSFYRFTLTNNITWVFTNHIAGRDILLQITENATGGWTNAWPGTLLWPGGEALNGCSISNSLSVFKILDNGTSWLAESQGLDYEACVNCYALKFDGAYSYVSVPGDSVNFYPTNFTLEGWIKTTSTVREFYFGTYNGATGYLMHNELGGEIYADFGDIFSVDTGVNIFRIADGKWHHLAFTYDGATLQTFIDGTPTGGMSIDPPITNSSPFLIGGDDETGSPTGSFTGIIDEVRLSRVVRNIAGECSEGCSACPHSYGVDSNTVAYWKFNEGGGSTANDSSGNGHNGTLYGSPPPAWTQGR